MKHYVGYNDTDRHIFEPLYKCHLSLTAIWFLQVSLSGLYIQV